MHRLIVGRSYFILWQVQLPHPVGDVEGGAGRFKVLGREPHGKWELLDAGTGETIYLFDEEILSVSVRAPRRARDPNRGRSRRRR